MSSGRGVARPHWTYRLRKAEMAWLREIACAGVDPDLFVTGDGLGSGAQILLALDYCDRCPVREACRDFMLETRPQGPRGIVAGGWVFRVNGRTTPHPADIDRHRELVAAAAVRLGEPIPSIARAA